MSIEGIQFLHSKEGQRLLEKYNNLTSKELDFLALKLSKQESPFYAELITLLKLRLKAISKFSLADSMFFTTDGLEQASDEQVSKYISQRFKDILSPKSQIVDLTCGLGGNTIFLAKYFSILAVDSNEVHIECTRYNAQVYGVDKSIEFIIGNAEDNIKPATAFFLDPQRLRLGETKTRSLENSSPNIFDILPKIIEKSSNICLKISPTFDYDEIEKLPLKPEIEVISEKNTNKATLLWFGDFKSCQRRATIFIEDNIVSFIDKEDKKEIPFSRPDKYIYEPNKAIIKAHLIDEIADQYDLKKINPMIGLLTSEDLIEEKDIFRTFEVVETQPFSLKKLKKLLISKSINRSHIMTRRFPENADYVRKRLKLKEGGEYTIILTVLANEKRYFILTKHKSF